MIVQGWNVTHTVLEEVQIQKLDTTFFALRNQCM